MVFVPFLFVVVALVVAVVAVAVVEEEEVVGIVVADIAVRENKIFRIHFSQENRFIAHIAHSGRMVFQK